MNPMTATIVNLLNSHSVNLLDNNTELAVKLANALTVASWQQLADVTGSTLEQDNDGQLVIYTGCHVEQAEPITIHARDLTPEELEAEATDNGWAEPF